MSERTVELSALVVEFDHELTKLLNAQSHSAQAEAAASLTALDALLRSSNELRTSLPERFFGVMLPLLRKHLAEEEEERDWHVLQLAAKCIKNSAASFRKSSAATDGDEAHLCTMLCAHVQQQINAAGSLLRVAIAENAEAEDEEFKFYLYTFQYFANRVLAHDPDARFVELSWRVLSESQGVRLRPALLNVLSLIIVSGSPSSSAADDVQSWTVGNYLSVFASALEHLSSSYAKKSEAAGVDEDVYDELIEEAARGELVCWPLRLAARLVDSFVASNHFAVGHDALTPFAIEERLDIYRLLLLKFNSGDHDRTNTTTTTLGAHLVDSFVREASAILDIEQSRYIQVRFCFRLVIVFLFSINKTRKSLTWTEEKSKTLQLIKLLAQCICDMVTAAASESGEDESSRATLRLVQDSPTSDGALMRLTCELVKRWQRDNEPVKITENNNNNNNNNNNSCQVAQPCRSSNLKCVLIRLVGVLVYENKANQRLLVDYGVLDILAKWSTLDMNNLFAREWAIVALKHILACLDLPSQ